MILDGKFEAEMVNDQVEDLLKRHPVTRQNAIEWLRFTNALIKQIQDIHYQLTKEGIK